MMKSWRRLSLCKVGVVLLGAAFAGAAGAAQQGGPAPVPGASPSLPAVPAAPIEVVPSLGGEFVYEVIDAVRDTRYVANIDDANGNRRGTVTVLGQNGRTTYRVSATNGDSIEVLVKPNSGSIVRNGQAVAGWETDAAGVSTTYGFDKLGGDAAFYLFVFTLQDQPVTASVKKWLPGVLKPLLPVTIGLAAYCLAQCECCDSFYSGQPAPGTPEPSCCPICFGNLCGLI